jgi:hypothetical protein
MARMKLPTSRRLKVSAPAFYCKTCCELRRQKSKHQDIIRLDCGHVRALALHGSEHARLPLLQGVR